MEPTAFNEILVSAWQWIVANKETVIFLLICLSPAVLKYISKTKWGKNNEATVEFLVDLFGQMKRANLPAADINKQMKLYELSRTSNKGIIETIRKARDKMDPKWRYENNEKGGE
jgi:hypothetical protein